MLVIQERFANRYTCRINGTGKIHTYVINVEVSFCVCSSFAAQCLSGLADLYEIWHAYIYIHIFYIP